MEAKGTPESNPWEDKKEHDAVIASYLLERIAELSDRELARITPEQASELDPDESEGFKKAVLNSEAIEYIKQWVLKYKISIDIQRLIREGEKNFTTLLGAYKAEFSNTPEEENN